MALAAYIIAARRSAVGRIGGLHGSRRIEVLAAPVFAAALADARIAAEEVDEAVIGNMLTGGNPARLIALAAGVAERTAALTIDRGAASGLDAVLIAVRSVATGAAEVVLAGGAECVSTAPWRVVRPRNAHQQPHFQASGDVLDLASGEGSIILACEALAIRHGFGRTAQDAFAAATWARGEAARAGRRLADEIVALRGGAEEARDQATPAMTTGGLADLDPLLGPDGTLTSGNTSSAGDCAAAVVVVSQARWQALGRPAALRVRAATSIGVAPAEEAAACGKALVGLFERCGPIGAGDLASIETSEVSAVQVLAMASAARVDVELFNPAGGAIHRGYPAAAAGAVNVVRIYADLVRTPQSARRLGIAVQGASGGLAVAALFEAVG